MGLINTSPRYSRAEAKAYARAHLRGVWGAIPYPFTADDELDEQGLRDNIRYCIENRLLDGIYCGHFMSEFWALTTEERKRAAEIVIDECRDRVPVMIHIGHTSVKESVELAHHAERTGADYLAVGNPYFMAYDDEQIYSYFRYISDRTEAGILITNTGYTGITLSPQMVSRLADLENIIAVKNSPKMPHTLETLRLVGDRILVSQPDERNFFGLMVEHGCQLYMSSASPFLIQKPGYTLIKDYTALVSENRIEEAAAVARRLDPARQVFDKWLRDPWPARRVMPIAYLKAWCDLMGMVGGPVRPPLMQITPEEREELRQDVANAGLI
ncbi:MAG TPA: dihydrodipicolinate synthase family protein [Ktedonobacteraceae bacterium]|nr:dihydrodipicolinate synthase family protein [Ktedonobacteraceae bacterium]